MNILIVSMGAVRECISDIKDNLELIKSSVGDHETISVFSSWHYDSLELNKQLEGYDHTLFFNQKDEEYYPKTRNGMPCFSWFHLRDLSKEIKKLDLEFDYVIKTRHDLAYKMNNIDEYLTDGFSVPKIFWCQGSAGINDHVFVTKKENFLKIGDLTDEELREMAASSHNGEALMEKMISPIDSVRIINDEHIDICVSRRRTENLWGWKQG